MIYIFSKETKDGLSAVKPNPAVPENVLTDIYNWKSEGVSQHDWLQRLRLQMVPSGYVPCTWTGKFVEN